MSKIFENIATTSILWGICMATGMVFNRLCKKEKLEDY